MADPLWKSAPAYQPPAQTVIKGPPREPAPQTAAQAAKDSLDVTRTQQLINRDARTAEFDARKAEADAERARLDAEKARREAANPAMNATESERKASAFLSRAIGANRSYEATGTGPRSLVGQKLADSVPNFLNSLPGSIGNSPERQVSDSAQDEFIAASLRQDSGAAIPDAELERQRRIYFPMPGDGPDAIEQKRQARLRAIDGLFQAGGRAITPEQKSEFGKLSEDMKAALTGTKSGPGDIGFSGPPSGPTDDGYRTISADGSSNAPSEAAKTFAQIASDAFQKGASRGDLDVLSAQYGFPPFGPDLDRAIAMRDKGYRGPVYFSPPKGESTGPTMLGTMAASAPGAYFGQAANVLSAGTLDELAGLTGGDAERAQWAKEAMREAHPYASFAGDLTGAGLQGFALSRIPSLAARPLLTGTAAATAYGGGEYNNNRLVGALGSGTAAAALGAGGNALFNRATTRAALPPGGQQAVDLARAADEEGIRVSRPLLDPSRRDRMAYLEASPGSGNAIRTGLQNTTDDIEAGVERLGRGGIVQEGGDLGQQVQNSGVRFIDRSRSVGRRLYDRATQMASGSRIEGREAVRVLDENIAELSQNPNSNSPLINYLREVRRDFVDDAGNLIPKDVGAIRDMRTSLRGQISNRNLMATDAERRVGQVLDAARTDITRDLSRTAPQAVRQYERADRFWAERQAEIKQVVQRVIGRSDDRLSGEQVMAKLKAMAAPNGDSARLERMMAKLSADERADVAATIAARLGRRSAEEDFSPALFVSSVRALSPAARRTIFGVDGARSIANLRSLAEAQRDTIARLNNSRSGMVQNWGSFLRQFSGGGSLGSLGALAVGGDVLTTGGVGVALGAASAGAGAGLRNLSARALMSPDLSRWLAAAPRAASPAAIQRHIARLPAIASRDPAIAQDVTALYRALSEAVNDNTVARAVASPDEGKANE